MPSDVVLYACFRDSSKPACAFMF